MSWEEYSRNREPCPCGKGEFEVIHRSDDWGRHETRYEMLCPDCKKKYIYDNTLIYAHPGKEIERGWTLKSVIEAEQRHRAGLEEKVRLAYLKIWKSKFEMLTAKKDIWELLTLNGKYYPSLGTFYIHAKGKSRKQILEYIDGFFKYSELRRIFEVCGVKPDLRALGANDKEILEFDPD